MDTKSVFKDALQLRPAERLLLIEMLSKSLNQPDEKIEKIWSDESEKRYKALEENRVKSITINEIIERYKQMQIKFIESASIELDDAIEYYKLQLKNLGKKFLKKYQRQPSLYNNSPIYFPRTQSIPEKQC